jgi:hypothetical protein
MPPETRHRVLWFCIGCEEFAELKSIRSFEKEGVCSSPEEICIFIFDQSLK